MSDPFDGIVTRRVFLRGALGLGASMVLAPKLGRALPVLPEDGEGYQWLAGDFHTHTIYSKDVGHGHAHANAGEEASARGWTPAEQIQQAELRGLDFLAITDHNTVRQLSDPGYASESLLLVPGYEHSLAKGHAGLLGVRKLYSIDTSTNRGLQRLIAAVHRDHGLVVAHHPRMTGHSVRWAYPTSIRPDAVETWNNNIATQDNENAIKWWAKEFLAHGRMPATASSDIHFRERSAQAGVGQPTTWVYARRRSVDGILEAVRAGRTTMSSAPPKLGGARVLMTASQGSRSWTIGDTVRTSKPVKLHTVVEGASSSFLNVMVDGKVHSSTFVTTDLWEYEATVAPKRYVRAEVVSFAGRSAMTSPIYFARP